MVVVEAANDGGIEEPPVTVTGVEAGGGRVASCQRQGGWIRMR
ncbi:unnamed protein product [Cuscuta epithymum]|nr:unnamed protein product [Cuscuta epithymum]